MFDVVSKIVEEMKTKPFTMIVLLGLWVAVGSLWTGRVDSVSAGEFAALKSKVTSVEDGLSSVKNSVEKSGLETQLRNIQTELFQLTQQVTDKQAKGIAIDQIYWDRIANLQNDRDAIQRKLLKMKD